MDFYCKELVDEDKDLAFCYLGYLELWIFICVGLLIQDENSQTQNLGRTVNREGTKKKRNRETGRVPKAVHCALQSKGKESRVHPNHTPSVPLLNLDHQTAEPTSTKEFLFWFTMWRETPKMLGRPIGTCV
ncbi:hypothetical protein CMV_010807 [Castanea mollissima]|uniref:Uncharacterized protein n=1 Tax=Castanea mollissima TaxID=60419 RepID=A0A8J4REJ7_9ROSI|nr:hypothetical protein CMV_010807 [Castanea mollissima]